jgi:acyl-CoA thioesterase-1
MKLYYPVRTIFNIAILCASFYSFGYAYGAHADATLPPSATTASPSIADETSQAIVVLGDSISAGYGIQREQGWVHLLDRALAQHEETWTAVNASISGETTGGGLARLNGVLEENEPDIVIIELGGNDGLRGYPIAKIRENLTAIVDRVKASGAMPIIVAMRIPPNYGPRYTRAFDAVFGEVAEAGEALFVPFLLEEVALAENLMQDDGIHPTAEAQPMLLDAVWTHLQPLL